MVNKWCVPAYRLNYNSVKKGVHLYRGNGIVLCKRMVTNNSKEYYNYKNTIVCESHLKGGGGSYTT